MWQGFGLGLLGDLAGLRGFEVDVVGASSFQGLVGSDGVEELPVALDFASEVKAVVDLEPVGVLVLQ